MEAINEYEIKNLANILNLLGDESRLQIIIYLNDKESCVNEIINNVNLSQPLVSHHLKVLKDANIVSSTKCGKKVIYKIVDLQIKQLLDYSIKNITHEVSV